MVLKTPAKAEGSRDIAPPKSSTRRLTYPPPFLHSDPAKTMRFNQGIFHGP
jgi:hypothetical protein